MADRLVLGCGDLCFSLIRTVNDQEGTLEVLDPSRARVENLRELSITAQVADVTDPSALEAASVTPDVVLIFTDDPEERREAVAATRTVYPDATLLSLPVGDGDGVDRTFSPGGAVLEAVEEATAGPQAERLHGLRETLQSMDGDLAILTHDNPDPDALGSALALRTIADRFDVEATISYFGDVTHQENRAFVNLLDVDLRQLTIPADLGGDHLALVDHSQPGRNNPLPDEMPLDIVIDHHPTPKLPDASFVDVREDVGATSTLLVDYLEGYEVTIDEHVATGLLYGIRVDTRDFGREATSRDLEAVATLLPHADLSILEEVENPSLSPQTFETIGRAIHNRYVEGGTLSSCVGEVQSRDAIAQAADQLLELRGITVAIVCGYVDETIHLSGRSRGNTVDLGEAFRVAYGELGSAGGHDTMAGAQIPLDPFQTLSSATDEDLTTVVARAVRTRFDEARETLGSAV